MRCNKLILSSIAATLLLSACAATRPALQPSAQGLGDAVAHNLDAHKVEPTPAQKQDTYIPADPDRVKLARDAYRAGTVGDLAKSGGTD